MVGKCNTPVISYFLLLFTGIFIIISSYSQTNYQFENFTTKNGLSDNRITCFYKDKKGFMWIGTENGLNRYDGHSFRIYNSGSKNLFISNPFVNDIEQDEKGQLWVATQSGLNVINSEKDSTFVFIPDENTDTQNETSISSDLIWDTYIDNKNRVWLASDERDFGYYDITTKKFTYFPWKKFVANKFPERIRTYNSIRKIYYKSENEIWLGSAAGLFSFNISTSTFHYHSSLQADHFMQLQQSPDNKTIYFIQYPSKILQVLSLTTNERKQIPLTAIPSDEDIDQSFLGGDSISWLPGIDALVGINTVSGKMIKTKHIPDNPYSLQEGIIRIVFKDANGLVWIGGNHGFGKFNTQAPIFHFTSIWPKSSLSFFKEKDAFRLDHSIHTVFYSEIDNKYYISSPENNCLVILDPSTGIKKIVSKINGIALKNCSVIYEDHNKSLWILANNTAFQYDRKKTEFNRNSLRICSSNLLFTNMVQDKENNYWISAFGDGLYKYSASTKSIQKIDKSKGFDSHLPTTLYYDHRKNQLWAGTFGTGVYRFDLNLMKLDNFISGLKAPGHLRSSLITGISGDNAGNILIATHGAGIAVYSLNGDSSKFRHLGPLEELPETNIYSLAADRNGNIWATHFKGLTCIQNNGTGIKNYSQENSLNAIDFFGPITRAGENTLLTAVQNGFVTFSPDTMQRATSAFTVVITNVHAKNLNFEDPANDISLSLEHNDNQVEFSFAALTYWRPNQTVYRYMLAGLDKNWISTAESYIKYNSLAPGKYQFKVKAIDHTGKYSENTADFSFIILPPWWATWWFTLICIITLSVVIGYLVNRRIQTIKNKAALRQHITELKAQALRAQMNPHFIFNCLNAIQELIITGKYTASHQYLYKFSRLLRHVLHVSEKNLIPLADEVEICNLYIELESLRFKNSFNYEVSVDPRIDSETTLFPTLMAQPFIENAIWHGLRQKQGNKMLSVAFKERGNNILCTITDNGIGREMASQIKDAKIGSSHFESKGILLATQRMEILKSAFGDEAFLQVTDCKDDNGHAIGTKVEIMIASIEISPF